MEFQNASLFEVYDRGNLSKTQVKHYFRNVYGRISPN